MKTKEVFRAIESYLELKPVKMPEIREDPKYLRGIGLGALIIDEEGITIIIKNKKDISTLTEEITHAIDYQNSTGMRIVYNFEDTFYNKVLCEALAYCTSKIVCPKRKLIDIRPKLQNQIETKKWGQLKEAYLKFKKTPSSRIWHEIGYDLGEKVYKYVQETGKKEPVLMMMVKNRQNEKPFEVYKKILEEVTR